jgi:DNA-binding transcriptional LysR family regulator
MPAPLQQLSWDDIKLVGAIAASGKLAPAASLLGINHSTAIRRLDRLEAQLGVVLFHRHRAGYELTPAGGELARFASDMAEGVVELTRRVEDASGATAGELRITTSDSFFRCLLRPVIATFSARNPEIQLNFILDNSPLSLTRRDADVAIRAASDPPDGLVGRRVASIRWAVYGRDADFSGHLSNHDLSGRSWVALGDGLASLRTLRPVLDGTPAERIVLRVNSVVALQQAVASGIGVGYLPCFSGERHPELRRLGPPTEPVGDLWLLTHPDMRHSTRVRLFLDHAAAALQPMKHLFEPV